jgi:hypothetical protein
VLAAVGDGDAGATRGQYPPQLADGRFAVGHEIQQVICQHDINGTVAHRQRGDDGVEQRRVRCRLEHAHRLVAPDGPDLPVPQPAQVSAVATARVQDPQPRR